MVKKTELETSVPNNRWIETDWKDQGLVYVLNGYVWHTEEHLRQCRILYKDWYEQHKQIGLQKEQEGEVNGRTRNGREHTKRVSTRDRGVYRRSNTKVVRPRKRTVKRFTK